MTRILHLTPHLGGGVGKAVSGLICQSIVTDAHQHSVYALERPEKTQFSGLLEASHCSVRYAPSAEELQAAIADTDIVQIEFWNHPAIVKALCSQPLPSMRLVVWCHVSGLHQPAIPWGMVEQADRFLFTSPCSLELLREHAPAPQAQVVSSGGGMNDMPDYLPHNQGQVLSAGYVGTLNFSKLHPDYVRFAAAVAQSDFSVRMIGDEINQQKLKAQAQACGRPNLLKFLGYRTDVAAELAQLDVLIYLLNPQHYGTAENTLLEAMAMGVVPIVLDNPAERHIVKHGHTGLIVHTPEELAQAIAWLSDHPQERLQLAQHASTTVREKYTYARMAEHFNRHYRAAMALPKRHRAFSDIFGTTPSDWFLAFQPKNSPFCNGDAPPPFPVCAPLYEQTKGSVFHFLDYFPGDKKLSSWAEKLRKHAQEIQSKNGKESPFTAFPQSSIPTSRYP